VENKLSEGVKKVGDGGGKCCQYAYKHTQISKDMLRSILRKKAVAILWQEHQIVGYSSVNAAVSSGPKTVQDKLNLNFAVKVSPNRDAVQVRICDNGAIKIQEKQDLINC
jgi:hypothetical protein